MILVLAMPSCLGEQTPVKPLYKMVVEIEIFMQPEVVTNAKSWWGAPTMIGCSLGKFLKFATPRYSKNAFPEVLCNISEANIKR